MRWLKAHWRDSRLATIAFLVAAGMTVLLALRLVGGAVYWSNHAEMPVEPWMRIGYVAKSHRVPVRELHKAMGLNAPERRRIGEIAEDQGIPIDEFTSAIEQEVARLKAERRRRR